MQHTTHSRVAGSAAARGFTLVEMLVTVAIVAILAAIAYPSYTNQVAKARRAEMQGELVRLAQFMERIYTEYGCYTPATSTSEESCDGSATPAISTGSKYYDVDLDDDLTRDAFTITATPKGGTGQVGDGALKINNLGQRLWYVNQDAGTDSSVVKDWSGK